jgi:hypothetical protein
LKPKFNQTVRCLTGRIDGDFDVVGDRLADVPIRDQLGNAPIVPLCGQPFDFFVGLGGVKVNRAAD